MVELKVDNRCSLSNSQQDLSLTHFRVSKDILHSSIKARFLAFRTSHEALASSHDLEKERKNCEKSLLFVASIFYNIGSPKNIELTTKI